VYGLINNALQSMIRDKFGDDQWDKVLETSGVAENSFLTMRNYDDVTTYELAGAAAEVLGAPLEACLEMFGEYWVLEIATKSYGPLMDASGGTMVEFLDNLNTLHDRITGTFLNYAPPEFQIETLGDERYRIHYITHRQGLIAFVIGLLKGLAQRFNSELEIHHQEELEVDRGTHAIFEVSIG
jgi:guanylate cyclase soluble subunit beta